MVGQVVLISKHKSKSAELEKIIEALGCHVLHEHPRSIAVQKIAGAIFKKPENPSVKIIFVEYSGHLNYARYLCYTRYKTAKIVFLSHNGSHSKLADLVVTSSVHRVSELTVRNLLKYPGMFSFGNFYEQNPNYHKSDAIVKSIKQPILWAAIGYDKHPVGISVSQAHKFCSSIIDFSSKHNCFVFVVANIKNKSAAEIVKNRLMSNVNCYFADASHNHSQIERHYDFLRASTYVVYFGTDVKPIARLMELGKYLYILATQKKEQIFEEISSGGAVFFTENIPDPVKKTSPLNDIKKTAKDISSRLGLLSH